MRNELRFLAMIPLVALLGCESASEVTSYGLSVRYETTMDERGSLCERAGNSESSSSARLDHSEALPDLWVEMASNLDDDTFTVGVYEVTAYQPNTKLPASKKMLQERTYDQQFGDKASKENFHVDSEGVGYEIEVTGVPGAAGTCPSANPN